MPFKQWIILRRVEKALSSPGPPPAPESMRPEARGNQRKRLGAWLCQSDAFSLRIATSGLLLTQDAGLIPLHLHPGRIAKHQDRNRHVCARTSAKAQFPVHEFRCAASTSTCATLGKLLAKPADTQLAEFIMQFGLHSRCAQLKLRVETIQRRLGLRNQDLRSEARVRSRFASAAPDRRCCLRGWRQSPSTTARDWAESSLCVNRPEPQRTPVIHDQLQAAKWRC